MISANDREDARCAISASAPVAFELEVLACHTRVGGIIVRDG